MRAQTRRRSNRARRAPASAAVAREAAAALALRARLARALWLGSAALIAFMLPWPAPLLVQESWFESVAALSGALQRLRWPRWAGRAARRLGRAWRARRA
jgi:hypothetical protein